MNKFRLLLALSILTVIGAIFALGADQYLTLEAFRQSQSALQGLVDANYAAAVAGYFIVYVLVTALSIPGAAVMTLAGGALFGLFAGTVIVSFASTLGATLAFLFARFLFRDSVERRFASMTQRISSGIEKDGAYYLFTLRLVPVFPFFAINLAMALTRLKTWTFAWVSQAGMLAGTVVYINAGTQIGRIQDIGDVTSPALIGSFVILGLFPLLARKIAGSFAARRRYTGFRRPRQFDANLIVIGAGAAGLVTAYVAAAAKARVILIEKNRMGGDCLNTGCVPSKALLRSAKLVADIGRAGDFGLQAQLQQVDFRQVMQRVQEVISKVEPHDSVERYTALGVECLSGAATIESPWSVSVAGKTLTARSIVIATGGEPVVPPIPGLEAIEALTSDNLWALEQLPARLAILGGGPIGCEMAQAFARLGSEVTLIEMAPRLLVREDADAAQSIADRFAREGIRLLTGYSAAGFALDAQGTAIECQPTQGEGSTLTIVCDRVLVAVGRRAVTKSLGIEALGLETRPDGTLEVNEFLQTSMPNIYACGDVSGPYQLTNAAGHQGWYCAMNALFGAFRKFRVDFTGLPWAVFTEPELARVGLNEQEATAQDIDYEVSRYGLDDLDRAIADGDAEGFVKVLTVPGNDKILGVTIVGPHAGELIAEFALAIKNGLGLRKVLNTIHVYPTLAEGNKFAAGEWQKAHIPEFALRISARLLAWMRG